MLNLTNAETTIPIHEWLIERPNILFDSLEVVRLIITAHSQCVQENFYAKMKKPFSVVNIGRTCDYIPKSDDCIESLTNIYPW